MDMAIKLLRPLMAAITTLETSKSAILVTTTLKVPTFNYTNQICFKALVCVIFCYCLPMQNTMASLRNPLSADYKKKLGKLAAIHTKAADLMNTYIADHMNDFKHFEAFTVFDPRVPTPCL